MSKKLIGLDLGSTAIRAVEVDGADTSRPVVVRFAETPLPEGAVRAGEVIDATTVTAALKSLWSSAGFRSGDVVLGVGNSKVIARDITVPAIPLAQIRESLPFQVQDLLPVPPSDSLLDFYPVSEVTTEDGTMLKGMLVAAVKAPVLRLVDAVQAAGLTVKDVDITPFALSRLFAANAPETAVQLLLHIGASSTIIAVLVGRVPQMIRILPSGGAEITRGISRRMDVSLREAEAIKHTVGVIPTHATADQRGALEVTFELVNDILVAVRDTISYFANAREGTAVDRIVMSGGGSRLEGLAPAVAEFSRLPVDLLDPMSVVSVSPNASGTGDPFGFSVALGLAQGVPA